MQIGKKKQMLQKVITKLIFLFSPFISFSQLFLQIKKKKQPVIF